MTPSPFRSLRSLDEIQHLAQLEAFAPETFIAALAAEATALSDSRDLDLEALAHQLDSLRDVLGAIDALAQKAMGIRLTHALAAAPLPPQLRTLLKLTVLSYQSDLPLLRARISAGLGRIDPATAAAVTAGVMDAAERVLALRTELRQRLFGLASQLAGARLPTVRPATHSRALPREGRQRWAQAVIDLEHLVASPAVLAIGTFAERLTQIEPPPDDPEPEPTRGSLLEID